MKMATSVEEKPKFTKVIFFFLAQNRDKKDHTMKLLPSRMRLFLNMIVMQAGYRRPLHWVFKIGSLDKSMEFYEKVFGMHVHRHEEFASGCEATCNGPYGGAWSKTMVGYKKEDTNFALELTVSGARAFKQVCVPFCWIFVPFCAFYSSSYSKHR